MITRTSNSNNYCNNNSLLNINITPSELLFHPMDSSLLRQVSMPRAASGSYKTEVISLNQFTTQCNGAIQAHIYNIALFSADPPTDPFARAGSGLIIAFISNIKWRCCYSR